MGTTHSPTVSELFRRSQLRCPPVTVTPRPGRPRRVPTRSLTFSPTFPFAQFPSPLWIASPSPSLANEPIKSTLQEERLHCAGCTLPIDLSTGSLLRSRLLTKALEDFHSHSPTRWLLGGRHNAPHNPCLRFFDHAFSLHSSCPADVPC
jgi:hypothetical protein